MPDPFEELESFKQQLDHQGLPVIPLPAFEVRRRGDRLRRRNNTLTALGTLAAATVLVATPLAVASDTGGRGSDTPPIAGAGPAAASTPAGPGVAWKQEIPAGFPLAEGLPTDVGTLDVRDVSVIDDFQLCGEVWSTRGAPPAVDVAGATWLDEQESDAGRTLALYADDVTAQEAFANLEQATADCQQDRAVGRDRVIRTWESDLAGEQSFRFYTDFLDESGQPEGTVDAFQVVRTGNAILIDHSYGQGGSSDEVMELTYDLMADRSAAVVSDLCVFAAQPCELTDLEPDAGAQDTDGAAGAGGAEDPAATGRIPDGFDLLAGLPTDEEAATPDFGRYGPNPGGAAPEVRVCGVKEKLSGDTVESLTGGFRDVAGARDRALLTFPSGEAAEQYVIAAQNLLARCSEVTDPQGVTERNALFGSALGESGVVAVTRFEIAGEPGPGNQLTHVVRVGRAVLVSVVSDEEGVVAGEQGVSDLISDGETELRELVGAMCVFNEEGC